MSKNSRKKNKIGKKIESQSLRKETKQSVWALIFFAFSILLILAGFDNSGKVGEKLFSILFWLLGWGYIFLPIIFIGGGINFLSQKSRKNIYRVTLWGSIVFLFGSLGFVDVFKQNWGGVMGSIAGYPSVWFGNVAWGVITFILLLIGIIITLDQPIKIKRDKEDNEKKINKKESINSIPIPMAGEPEEKNNPNKGSGIQTKQEEKNSHPNSKTLSNTNKKTPDKNYMYPPYDILRVSSEKPNAGDLRANANIIKRTLESFGMPVEMGEINIGPKVTRYTLRPAEGIKLSRITSLSQDLSLALAASPIRIEAPIPGKPYVGIEIPNRKSSMVRLGNLMSYPEFKESSSLTFPLGKDVTGKPIFSNIEKMPHLLIAGATGSGKSISLHSLLISLLYKNSPAHLKLVLIDPKRVELSSYSDIPHLIAPVVTQGKKSLGVFRWAISEMERRYEVLLAAGSRDIQSYNKKNGDSMAFILIVVDEMADLMAAYGRDIENAIVRLAQMARATGIHLILSTQRPSVEVITGLIKANITSRIALQVASQIDSRTILDTAGAEKLLGGGDFLFSSAELSKPKRIQGAYISEEEVENITKYIRDNNKDYINKDSQDITGEEEDDMLYRSDKNSKEGNAFDSFQRSDDDDELLADAIETVRDAKKASASFLQRKFRIGYARAARLLDIMEDRGIVGRADGAKAREVYSDEEISEE